MEGTIYESLRVLNELTARDGKNFLSRLQLGSATASLECLLHKEQRERVGESWRESWRKVTTLFNGQIIWPVFVGGEKEPQKGSLWAVNCLEK